jgi:MFS family permease
VDRIGYRWVILGASTAVTALAWSVRSTFALFFVAMIDDLAWGRGATAFGYSLTWLGFVVFAPAAGWLFDRSGARAVVIIGGALLGAALALTSRVTSAGEYYLWFGGLGAAGIALMFVPATTIVTRWFVRARGTAMGILSTGNPASAVLFYPINAWLITTLGWRSALLAFGAIVTIATVVFALLYRDPPSDAAKPATQTVVSPEAWTLRRALRNSRLWAAVMMTLLGHIGFNVMATHQVAYAVDHGFAQATVVWIFAFGAGCMMAGNLLGGWLSDQLGRGWVFALGSLIVVAGIGALMAVKGPHDTLLLVVYTASGFGFGMRIAQLAAIPADVFAGPHLGAILGVVQAGGGLGGAIGPYLGGWLFDVTGSYRLAFAVAAVATAGAAVAAWLAARPNAEAPATTTRDAMIAP